MTQQFDLGDKITVVTGGSRGLGYAIAQGFAEAGADVVIASRKLTLPTGRRNHC
jgi:NAD(P)-dependent dehydrogenase (short-subunit alcohol dehydrogenase family)